MPEVIESVPNTFPGLFAAYSAIWILLSVYILRLGVRISRLERRKDSSDQS